MRRRDPSRSPLGTNLDFVADWSPELPFVDAFRQSRPWTSAPELRGPPDERPVDVDERGWVRSLLPGQWARTCVIWENPHAPRGRYTVLYEGTGELVLWGEVEGRDVASETGPGRITVQCDPATQGAEFGLAIRRTDRRDPIRNIRVLLPGGACENDDRVACQVDDDCEDARCVPFEETYQTQIFNPRFLAEMEAYGAIRFMNWQQTNQTEVRRWSERAQMHDAHWTMGRGVPFEVMIDLANRMHADAWINIPHRADDDFIVQTGRLFAERLAPERRVYVEYSNEVWNAQFPQAEYARQEGNRLRLAGSDGDEFMGHMRFHARRSVQMFGLFSRGFPDRQRVVRVLGSQTGNEWLADLMLSFEDTAAQTDALAVAPYFGMFVNPEGREAFLAQTNAQILEHTAHTLVPATLAEVRTVRAVATRYHVDLLAYEAGQHFIATEGLESDAEVNRRLDEIDRDPRFEEIYRAYFEGWREAGGGLLMHFVHCAGPSQWGRWGATYWLGQSPVTAPKLRAILRFVDTHERWW